MAQHDIAPELCPTCNSFSNINGTCQIAKFDLIHDVRGPRKVYIEQSAVGSTYTGNYKATLVLVITDLPEIRLVKLMSIFVQTGKKRLMGKDSNNDVIDLNDIINPGGSVVTQPSLGADHANEIHITSDSTLFACGGMATLVMSSKCVMANIGEASVDIANMIEARLVTTLLDKTKEHS